MRLAGLPIKRVPQFIDLLSHLEVFGRNPSRRMRDKTYRNFVVGNIQVRMMLPSFRHVSNSTGKEHGGGEARESEATLEHSVVNLPVGKLFQVRLDFLVREFYWFLWHSELLSKSHNYWTYRYEYVIPVKAINICISAGSS